MTCIEDYSDSTRRGMAPFMKLSTVSLPGLPAPMTALVRIAVFGDSFIEADIFTADLREMLQKRFGGCGVGFVTITSMTSGYRPTVRHQFGGWASHAVTDSVYFDRKNKASPVIISFPGMELMWSYADRANTLRCLIPASVLLSSL